MDTRISVKVKHYSESFHLYQLYAGLGLLKASGKIACTFERAPSYHLRKYGSYLLTLTLNDHIKVVYDVDDRGDIALELLDWCDFYFKRSYVHHSHAELSAKIQPLGFNYLVYGPHMGFSQRVTRNIPSLKVCDFYKFIEMLACNSKLISGLFSLKAGISVNWFRKFEGIPQPQKQPKIIFMTQVWKPYPITDKQIIEERLDINKMRCECINLLRKEFPGQFYGGIFPSDYALAAHRNYVIADKRMFHKKNFLDRMHASDICIATMGLFGSNGWKLAEYVAGPKSIVSEKLHFEVPGEFVNGRNYLEFTTPEQCVSQVRKLVDDTNLRYAMMKRNSEYYLAYLQPDVLVWNSLQKALECSG